MAQHHSDFKHWPFLNEEEFELACAFFDRRYIRAKLGPARQAFKIRSRRIATTGTSYIEILRLIRPPEDADELSLAFKNLGADDGSYGNDENEMRTDEDADLEALRPNPDLPPQYSLHSHQPYVTYEIHLHPTYKMPTLWFTLHDLPMGEPAFDIEAIYRHLVPSEFKSRLRAAGVMGGISVAPHPVTDLPAFFIHPCQTKEAMEDFDCPMEDYMMVWVGLVGGCIGLWIPPEMA